MSKKTTETTTMNYDPNSLGVYGSLQNPIQNTLMDYMKDPLKAMYFGTQLQMAQKQNSLYNQSAMKNITGNINASGFGGQNLNPFLQSAIARQARAGSAMQSNTFNGLLLGANQMRLGATAQAQGYTPLLNGQTSVTKTSSGVMGWLPGVMGAAAGAALAPFTGGASLLAIPGALSSMNNNGGGGGGNNFGSMMDAYNSYKNRPIWGGTNPTMANNFPTMPSTPPGINPGIFTPGSGGF